MLPDFATQIDALLKADLADLRAHLVLITQQAFEKGLRAGRGYAPLLPGDRVTFDLLGMPFTGKVEFITRRSTGDVANIVYGVQNTRVQVELGLCRRSDL